MHAEARDFIARQVAHLAVLEIGSLNVNGGIRDLFPGWDYLGIDLQDGPGVDVVADGSTFDTPKRFDVVVSCEAFEHTANWKQVCGNAVRLLRPGGIFMGTAAGPGRPAHKCSGEPLTDGSEYYGNVCPVELASVLSTLPVCEVAVEHRGRDVRWFCRKLAV
jgi:SAM-dependent methyltransferase